MEFFPEIAVTADEAEAIARGLYGVAQVDGVHERELALISDLYQGVAGERTHAVAPSLERVGSLTPNELSALLTGQPHRELFVKASFLLAWADGKLSPAERAKIAEYGRALSVGDDAQAQLEAEVKDFLLRPLAGLANVEATSAVAKKLGM